MDRENQNRAANHQRAIRSKNWFWRATMRREAGGHENFFIAKNRDSESAQRSFERHSPVAMTPAARRSISIRITKTIAAQALSAIPAIIPFDFHGSLASLRGCVVALSTDAHRALARRHVNTSLSGHCFF
jgi:hypothetical protein